MKVYVSGSITGLSLDVARKRFADAADGLAAIGHEPLNPFDVPPHWNCDCPVPFAEAASDIGAGGGHAWGCYLRGDLAALLDCDAILMLPGWETSHGARLELTVASAVGLKVLIGDGSGEVDPAPPRRRRIVTDDLLREVAKVYRAAYAASEPPTVAVSEHFETSHSTATRWVTMARKSGALGPAQGTRPGEAQA